MAILAEREIKQNEHFLAKMSNVVEQVLIAHGMLQNGASQMDETSAALSRRDRANVRMA